MICKHWHVTSTPKTFVLRPFVCESEDLAVEMYHKFVAAYILGNHFLPKFTGGNVTTFSDGTIIRLFSCEKPDCKPSIYDTGESPFTDILEKVNRVLEKIEKAVPEMKSEEAGSNKSNEYDQMYKRIKALPTSRLQRLWEVLNRPDTPEDYWYIHHTISMFDWRKAIYFELVERGYLADVTFPGRKPKEEVLYRLKRMTNLELRIAWDAAEESEEVTEWYERGFIKMCDWIEGLKQEMNERGMVRFEVKVPPEVPNPHYDRLKNELHYVTDQGLVSLKMMLQIFPPSHIFTQYVSGAMYEKAVEAEIKKRKDGTNKNA